MLRVGERAKYFEANDLENNLRTPLNFKGEYLFISFLKSETCPFCKLHLYNLRRYKEKLLENNITCYEIFHSSNERINNFLKNYKCPKNTHIIAKENLDLHSLYESNINYSGMVKTFHQFDKYMEIFKLGFLKLNSIKTFTQPPIIPSDFLIDKNGIIQIAHYGKDFSDNIEINRVLSKVQEFKN